MRIPTQVRLFEAGTLAFAGFLCLSAAVGWSQTNPPAKGTDSTTEEKSWKSQEALPLPQQLQEQHQQLLKAIDLIRQDAEVNVQRYAVPVDRIRQETEQSLQRFVTAVDGKLDFLNGAFITERERELQSLRRSNRFALTIASVIVGVLLLEIFVVAWMSVRAANRLAVRISAWVCGQSPYPGTPVGPGGNAARLMTGSLVEETNWRLQNALERLERCLLDLEGTASRFQTAVNRSPSKLALQASESQSSSKLPPAKPAKPPGVSLALGHGESLILLPHEKGVASFHSYRSLLQKLRKRCQLAWAAKGH
ncbi:MAG TPA: hypothetical protein VFA77_15315 [Candidatus Eisenbacteria bacterium]|jgi:hypothetical protein|nr:hypothetical protein [Candidatus Eisenbacteria bacterium]